MNTPKLYTVKEAAQLVGVSTNTLYKYLDDGKIKAARGSAIQGRFRIPEAALEEFLGIKLSQPEAEVTESVGATFTVASPDEPINPVGPATRDYNRARLPLKFVKILLILALLAILLDLFISRAVSLPAQIARLFFLAVFLLLAYQEGGYRRGIRPL